MLTIKVEKITNKKKNFLFKKVVEKDVHKKNQLLTLTEKKIPSRKIREIKLS